MSQTMSNTIMKCVWNIR